MDIDALRLLVDVARRGSFAAVARERGVDPSSVSRPIAALEAELGARLLQRTTRAMTLTDAGKAYVTAIAPLVSGLDDARDAIASSPSSLTGAIRITASVAFGEVMLAPLLPALRAALPRVRLELELSDANLDLVADRIDIALRLAPSYRADVIGAKLFATRYRVVATPRYVERAGAITAPADLAGHNCVLSAVPDFRTRWMFRRGGDSAEVFVDGGLVSSNALALRSAALAGLGPALLADWLIDEPLANGELIDLLPAWNVAATDFDTAAWLLYPSREHLPRRVRVAIDFLRQHLTRADAGRAA